MAKSNKFTTLLESYMRRNQRGGFLVGDVFKFNDNFKSDDAYKDLADVVKKCIDSMIDSGLNIRVINIKDTSPARYPASDQTSSLDVVLDIALDTGGGRYTDETSIPCCLGSCDQYAPNLPPIPDGQRRKDKVTIKPEEVEENEENLSNKTDRGDGKLSQTELTLKKESYTQQYL